MGHGKRARGLPWLGAMAFSLASIVNPALFTGCSAVTGPTFEFGETEMLALLAETDNGPYRAESGKVEVVFELQQRTGQDEVSDGGANAIRPAHACGRRSFMRRAGACLDTTQVKVEGVVTVQEIAAAGSAPKILAQKVPVTGTLVVHGTKLDSANLHVESADKKLTVWMRSDRKTFDIGSIALEEMTL